MTSVLADPGVCRCRELDRLETDDALRYTEHLRLSTAADDGWSASWRCPATGASWLEIHHVAWRPEDPATSLIRVDLPDATTPAQRRARWTPARIVTGSVSILLMAAIAAESFL